MRPASWTPLEFTFVHLESSQQNVWAMGLSSRWISKESTSSSRFGILQAKKLLDPLRHLVEKTCKKRVLLKGEHVIGLMLV